MRSWFLWVPFFLLLLPDVFAHGGEFSKGTSDSASFLDTPDQVATALDQLRQAYDSGNISSQGCHLQAHALGRRSFELNSLSRRSLLWTHTCRSGFIHGLFEKAVASANRSTLTSLCPEKESVQNARSLNCLHGVGHGLYARFEDVNRSLGYCKEWTAPWVSSACATGVFMDAFLGGHANRPADQNESNPFLFCSRFDFREDCIRYAVIGLQRRQLAPISVSSCAAAPFVFSTACYQGVGAFSAKWNNYDLTSIVRACVGDADCLSAAAFESGFSQELIKGATLCSSLGWMMSASCWMNLFAGYSLTFG